MEIIPALNTNDPDKAIEIVNELSEVILPQGFPLERIQIDVNDGTFENIKTITPEILTEVETKMEFDYHLMVGNPISWVERCIRGQAERVIGHIEKMDSQLEFVEKATELGVKVGFALDIDTAIDEVDESLMTSIDVILLMSYPAGAGGKKLEERVFEKIEKLVEIKNRTSSPDLRFGEPSGSGKGFRPGGDSTPFKIYLDGGITLDNIKRIKLAGVDEVAITKRVLEGDIEENLEKFYKAIY